MSIAEAVAKATDRRLCKFGRVLKDLPGPDQQAILDGLDGGLTNTDAARILTDNGFPLSEKAVRAHKANECACGRDA